MPPDYTPGDVAWRFWSVLPDGSLTHAGRTPVDHRWARWGNVAKCPKRHPAPAERCFCGLHVLLDERELWELARRVRHAVAVGPVMVSGRVMRSEVGWDPLSTRRVERLSILGPLLLSPQARRYRDAVADRYGLQVVLEGWGETPPGDAPAVREDADKIAQKPV